MDAIEAAQNFVEQAFPGCDAAILGGNVVLRAMCNAADLPFRACVRKASS